MTILARDDLIKIQEQVQWNKTKKDIKFHFNINNEIAFIFVGKLYNSSSKLDQKKQFN